MLYISLTAGYFTGIKNSENQELRKTQQSY